ncbi:MAG TPA: AAA family ATPase [Armatimonadota bacterium]|nr:AAA family ATPase [Armatimonadota bacterium]
MQDFELSDHVVLAGHNNAGKTTLLQAIAVWNMALQKWNTARGPDTRSQAKQRTGVPISRSEFSAIPLREMKLLWTDAITGLTQKELEKRGQKQGAPRPLTISLTGRSSGTDWKLGFEIRYSNSELVYVKPRPDDIGDIPRASQDVHVVHVPPISGIGPNETKYDRPFQDMLIGQGKPGDILRNLLFELYTQDRTNWGNLLKDFQDIFGVTLRPPEYEGRPYILSEYQGIKTTAGRHNPLPRLDISNAGSGFHQVLVLLGFLYARPATVLLLDEPDAHQHIILQKQIYDRLRSIAERRKCQLILATHSEVIVDNTSPRQILSFYGDPHPLVSDTEREQVREALKRITAMDILLAEPSPGVLYVEGETDFNLLKAWASVLGHVLSLEWFNKFPYWHNNQGMNPREARSHFFAIRAIMQEMRGYLLLDGDNRGLSNHELGADGLQIGRWDRYEAESYLLHPDALFRYISRESGDLFAAAARAYMEDELPPAILRDPLGNHDYLRRTPASKTILPGLLEAGQVPTKKNEYYLIAEQMQKQEVAAEVKQKLDDIARAFGLLGV